MKALIFSDSHGRDTAMKAAIAEHESNIDLCIHLGDGTREFLFLSEKYPNIPFFYVHGNGEDAFAKGPDAQTVLDLDGYRIFLTHGHKYGVKGGTGNLIYKGMEEESDVILYGHTHLRDNRYIPSDDRKPLYIFNPGSITSPHLGDRASYGIMELTRSGIMFNHIKL